MKSLVNVNLSCDISIKYMYVPKIVIIYTCTDDILKINGTYS